MLYDMLVPYMTYYLANQQSTAQLMFGVTYDKLSNLAKNEVDDAIASDWLTLREKLKPAGLRW